MARTGYLGYAITRVGILGASGAVYLEGRQSPPPPADPPPVAASRAKREERQTLTRGKKRATFR